MSSTHRKPASAPSMWQRWQCWGRAVRAARRGCAHRPVPADHRRWRRTQERLRREREKARLASLLPAHASTCASGTAAIPDLRWSRLQRAVNADRAGTARRNRRRGRPVRACDVSAAQHRMIQAHRRGVLRISPVGDDRTLAEFPHAVALLVLVEVSGRRSACHNCARPRAPCGRRGCRPRPRPCRASLRSR